MNSDLPAGFPKDLLGRYDRISHLARGGMGVLFRAHDLTLDIDVAIKALPSRNLLGDEKIVRFQKEAKAAGRLSHPNIVKVLDFGVTKSGDPYLIMDFIDGSSLDECIERDGVSDLPTALSYFIQIARGLAYAHKSGIVHRDIKPNNIMIETREKEQSIAKIVDFGVAHMRRMDNDASGFDSTGNNIIGSPGYMSPEVVQGKKADQRSDIYSFGVLMFQTLAGHRPFRGQTAIETMKMHVSEPVPEIFDSLREANNQDLAAAISKVVTRCLSKKPEDRYLDAGELQAALLDCTQFLDEEASQAIVQSNAIDSGPNFKSWNLIAQEKSFKTVSPAVLAISVVVAAALVLIVGPLGWNAITGGARQKQEGVPIESVNLWKSAIGHADEIDHPLETDVLEHRITAEDMNEGRKVLRGSKALMPFGNIDDALMERLTTVPVSHLDICDAIISKKGLAQIANMKSLVAISADRVQGLNDADLKIFQTLPRLEQLSLAGNAAITDKGLAEVAKCQNLLVVGFHGCGKITTAGIAQLKNVPKLGSLSIGQTNVSPLAIKNGFKALHELNLDSNRLTNEEMAVIASRPTLRHLTLTNCTVTREQLFMLLKCPRLEIVQKNRIKTLTPKDQSDFKAEYKKKYRREVVFSEGKF